MTDKQTIINDIKLMLSQKRFEHSIAVSQRAAELARIFNIDTKKAEIAGIVHDCCKEFSKSEQLKLIEGFGIILTEEERMEPNIWHGYAASGFITQKWGIDDKDIKSAVKYHTCGKKDMSILDKIIFVADLTSSDRNYSDADEIRNASLTDLDLAIYMSYKYIIPFIVNRKGIITKNTFDCYNDSVKCLKDKGE